MSVYPTKNDLIVARTVLDFSAELSISQEETASNLTKAYVANGLSGELAYELASHIVYSNHNAFAVDQTPYNCVLI